MLNTILATFYETDIRKLIEEVNLFNNEEDLWRTKAILAHTGYVRNRDLEFSNKDVPRQELMAQLEELIPLIITTLNSFTDTRMEAEFRVMFDGAMNSNMYVLTRLLAHMNYHLGQINYLRRILE
jgi:hypothetical protein